MCEIGFIKPTGTFCLTQMKNLTQKNKKKLPHYTCRVEPRCGSKLVIWGDFTEALRVEFSEEAYENVIDSFDKLVQQSSVKVYQEQSEALQPLVIILLTVL